MRRNTDPCNRWGNTAAELRAEAAVVSARSRHKPKPPCEDSKRLVKGRHYLIIDQIEVIYLGEDLYTAGTATSRVEIVSNIDSLPSPYSFFLEYKPEFINNAGGIVHIVPWMLKELKQPTKELKPSTVTGTIIKSQGFWSKLISTFKKDLLE